MTRFSTFYTTPARILIQALDNLRIHVGLTNMGIIVDANNVGVKHRWDRLKTILANSGKFDQHKLDAHENVGGGKIITAENMTIGVWIMPNNKDLGYLEHFLERLIPENDLWQRTQSTVDWLKADNLQLFADIKKQKALLHTWLAWQKEPGKPFGVAAQSGYFNTSAPLLIDFEKWFSATFVLAP